MVTALNSNSGKKGGLKMRLSDETLRGRTVISADGQMIGEIAALFLDTNSWRVESLLVKLRKDVADQIGATRGMFHAGTVETPMKMIQSVGDTVVLAVATDDLRQALPRVDDASATH